MPYLHSHDNATKNRKTSLRCGRLSKYWAKAQYTYESMKKIPHTNCSQQCVLLIQEHSLEIWKACNERLHCNEQNSTTMSKMYERITTEQTMMTTWIHPSIHVLATSNLQHLKNSMRSMEKWIGTIKAAKMYSKALYAKSMKAQLRITDFFIC